VREQGDVDLGEVRLPYYDPDTKTYAVAKGTLGTIRVKPGAVPVAADPQNEVLPGLPEARASLAPARAPARRLTDSLVFWLGLGGAPLAFVLFTGGRAAARRARARAADRKADPSSEMKARVADADRASKNGDPRAADAATAKALEAAAIACAEVNLRALRTREAEDALVRAGVEDARANELVALYDECHAARFSPDRASPDEAKKRWGRARTIIRVLERS